MKRSGEYATSSRRAYQIDIYVAALCSDASASHFISLTTSSLAQFPTLIQKFDMPAKSSLPLAWSSAGTIS